MAPSAPIVACALPHAAQALARVSTSADDGSSWRRDAVIDFAAGVTRPETVQINLPLEGFIHRVAETVATSTGGSSNVPEWIGLSLRGVGVTPVGVPDNQRLILSVTAPAA